MVDRSSRPHRSPTRTTAPMMRKIVHLRWKKRLGPVQIAGTLGMPASTVHAVLVRCRINRLTHVDRRTGEVIRRYEHDHPGSLVHVDVKKLGNIPDGGGWRFVGAITKATATGQRPPRPRASREAPQPMRAAFVHTVLDDHSRVVYSEIHDDESKRSPPPRSCAGRPPGSPPAASRIERVLSDNGGAYRSGLWRDTCTELGITPKWTRPYRPQTNGKIERFHRTLADGWAYAATTAQKHPTKALPDGSTTTTTTGPTPPPGTTADQPIDQPPRAVQLGSIRTEPIPLHLAHRRARLRRIPAAGPAPTGGAVRARRIGRRVVVRWWRPTHAARVPCAPGTA